MNSGAAQIVLVPRFPPRVDAIARSLVPPSYSLHRLCEWDGEFDAAMAEADCYMGLPRKKIDASLLAKAPRLRFIQLLRSGHDLVDVAATNARRIVVATVGDTQAGTVAEHVFMLMIAVSRRLLLQHSIASSSDWYVMKPWQNPKRDVATYPEVIVGGLAGKTLGLVGYGAIARRVARLATAFDMKVLTHTRMPGPFDPAERLPLEALLEQSDIVSLHTRLDPTTRNLMNERTFALMKPGALFLNTARGGLVDERALVDALESGRLSGAGLDTLAEEPPRIDSALLRMPNVVLTPHSAWLTAESWESVLRFGFANVARFFAGERAEFVVESQNA